VHSPRELSNQRADDDRRRDGEWSRDRLSLEDRRQCLPGLRSSYDLDLFGRGSLKEPLIRRLLVLKVWHDVVDNGLGAKPFDPAEIVVDIDPRRLPPEDIGLADHDRASPRPRMGYVRPHVRTRWIFGLPAARQAS
jgi:hypothetical protein